MGMRPPKPNKGKVFIKGKKVKISISKSTRNYSSLNNVFVGYVVGAGKFAKRFASVSKANSYSKKLLKSNKGLSGSGDERGVSMKPLYYGRRY